MTTEQHKVRLSQLLQQQEEIRIIIRALTEQFLLTGPVKKGDMVLLKVLERPMLRGAHKSAVDGTLVKIHDGYVDDEGVFTYTIVTSDGGCYLGSYAPEEFDIATPEPPLLGSTTR